MQKANTSTLWRTTLRVLIAATALGSPATAAEPGVARQFERGDHVLPARTCKIMSGAVVIPLKGRALPFIVGRVENEFANVGYGDVGIDEIVHVDDGEAYYTRWLAEEPDSIDAYHLRGVARFDQKRFADAVQDFEAASRLAPDNARLLCKLAEACLEVRGVNDDDMPYGDLARRSAARAGQLDPQSTGAICFQLLSMSGDNFDRPKAAVLALRMRGLPGRDEVECWQKGAFFSTYADYAAAEIEFTRAIQQHPTYAKAIIQRAISRRYLGQADESLRDYRRAVELDPKNPDVYVKLSNGLNHFGHKQEALDANEHALVLNPRHYDALMALAEKLTHNADSRYRNGPRALEAAKKAHELLSPSWRSLFILGLSYAEVGDFASAEATLLEAEKIGRRVGDNENAMNYALVRVRSGKPVYHD